jgi:malonyl-CoA decarboxylase
LDFQTFLLPNLVMDPATSLSDCSVLRHGLIACPANYSSRKLYDDRPVDPVSRFHLGHGSRLDQINWAADPSAKGFKPSFGLMSIDL